MSAPPGRADALALVWGSPATFKGWLGVVNHKAIGRRFLVTGLVFFLLGGVFALLARLQLALPELGLVNPQLYNEVFTMHGVTMAFLFIVPVLEGFAIFLLPLMIGARDLPFPRLTAFGYWVYLLSGIFIYASVLVGSMPDAGWYAYPPFAGPEFSPGLGMDFWLLGVTFLEISAIGAAVEIAALLVRNRAPGMTLTRIPVFAWTMLVTSFIIIFAFPTLVLGSVLLEVERKIGTGFYSPELGGTPILWQHLFWFFGHPDVYIWMLPGVGIVSMVITTFTRQALVGYTWVVASTVVIGVLSFGVWVHHMFTVGLPVVVGGFFGGASLVFAVASGVTVFAWVATLWRGTVVWSTAMLFAVGSIVMFTFGGLSGVTLGIVPINWQVHDTYYVVAHFHYVLIGSSVMPMFAGAYYWWPKLTGKMLDEGLGRWNFWLFLLGLNLTFLPQHVVGLLGMPRRIYTYLPGLGWELANLLAIFGAVVAAVSVLLFVANALLGMRRPAAPADPWEAGTLEWSVPTPVPAYNFRAAPVVSTRYPLWEQASLTEGDPAHTRWAEALREPRDGRREQLVTTELDGEPEAVMVLPQQSFWPLVTAALLAVALTGILTDLWWMLVAGMAASLWSVVRWAWPNDDFSPLVDVEDR